MHDAGIQMYDRWGVQRAQVKEGVPAHPWEAKGGLLYHIDLGLDLVIRVCCPLLHYKNSCCKFSWSTVMLLYVSLWVVTQASVVQFKPNGLLNMVVVLSNLLEAMYTHEWLCHSSAGL